MSLDVAIFAFKAVQAVSAVKQAKSQRRQLELQAQQQQVQYERQAIQKEQQGNELLRNRRMYNSAVISRAAAGGADPFSGSALTTRISNETRIGKDYQRLRDGIAAIRQTGNFNVAMTQATARQTTRTGYVQAATAIGEGLYGYAAAPKVNLLDSVKSTFTSQAPNTSTVSYQTPSNVLGIAQGTA